MTNQINTLTKKIDNFEQDVVIGFKNTIDMLSEGIKSFNQEASEFRQQFHKLSKEAKIDAKIASNFIDIERRVIPLDAEIAELNEKLANMPNLELLAYDKGESQNKEYDEYLPDFADVVVASAALALV